jgi:hypothetical protein
MLLFISIYVLQGHRVLSVTVSGHRQQRPAKGLTWLPRQHAPTKKTWKPGRVQANLQPPPCDWQIYGPYHWPAKSSSLEWERFLLAGSFRLVWALK